MRRDAASSHASGKLGKWRIGLSHFSLPPPIMPAHFQHHPLRPLPVARFPLFPLAFTLPSSLAAWPFSDRTAPTPTNPFHGLPTPLACLANRLALCCLLAGHFDCEWPKRNRKERARDKKGTPSTSSVLCWARQLFS